MHKNNLYLRAAGFWFILTVLAIINATIRELTYKPLLFPIIGAWAHQISSVTGIILIYIAIYQFVKHQEYNQKSDLLKIGWLWLIMTFCFETAMNLFIRKLTLAQILQTYYFWKGETWIFVLLSLLISPFVADYYQDKNKPE